MGTFITAIVAKIGLKAIIGVLTGGGLLCASIIKSWHDKRQLKESFKATEAKLNESLFKATKDLEDLKLRYNNENHAAIQFGTINSLY